MPHKCVAGGVGHTFWACCIMYLLHPHHPAHAESLQLGETSDLPMLHTAGKEEGGLAKMLMGPEKAVSLNSLQWKKLGKGIVAI